MFSGIRDLFKNLGFSHSRMVEDIIDLNKMFPDSMVHELEGLGTCRDAATAIKLSVHQLLLRKRTPDSPVCLWYKPEFDCGAWKGDHSAPDVDMGEQSTGVRVFKEAQTCLPALQPGIRQCIVDIDKNIARFEALRDSLPAPTAVPSDLPANMVRHVELLSHEDSKYVPCFSHIIHVYCRFFHRDLSHSRVTIMLL